MAAIYRSETIQPGQYMYLKSENRVWNVSGQISFEYGRRKRSERTVGWTNSVTDERADGKPRILLKQMQQKQWITQRQRKEQAHN